MCLMVFLLKLQPLLSKTPKKCKIQELVKAIIQWQIHQNYNDMYKSTNK